MRTFVPVRATKAVLRVVGAVCAIMVLSSCNQAAERRSAKASAEAAPPDATGQPKAAAFDFGGVFDDTIAGTIDRTVIPRRPDGPPNIVLIIADDLGWPYLGFLGDDNVMTPNMDVLGRGGAVFETGHSAANYCRPTLQSLITGLYPTQYEQRAGAIAEARMAASPPPPEVDTAREREIVLRRHQTAAIEEFETLPRILERSGYVSHQSGKWWEQSFRHGGFTHGMTDGWDWRDAAALGDRWFFTFMGGRGNEIGRSTMAPVTDFIADNADRPFFLWYAPALPHVPLNPPDTFYKYFENRDDLSESAKLYYANIAWFDWGVGVLLDKLRQERVFDNTLIVYINDNGWEQPPDEEYADEDINFANGGPRGKTSFFETAFRTPIFFYWADEIAARRDVDTLAHTIDVMPTILDYAGIEAPEGLPGYSLRPAIEGAPIDGARDFMIGSMDRHRAGTDFRGRPVDGGSDHMGRDLNGYYRRDRRWHFVWLPKTDETALYDLQSQDAAPADVAAAHPDLVAEFKADIDAWRRQYDG